MVAAGVETATLTSPEMQVLLALKEAELETEAQKKNNNTVTPCVTDAEYQLIKQMNVEPKQPNVCTVRQLVIMHEYAERKRTRKR